MSGPKPNRPGRRGPSLSDETFSIPDDAQGVEPFADRDNALKAMRKLAEVSRRDSTHDLYRANFDPSKPKAMVSFQATIKSVDRIVMEELGFASAITDWTKFPGVMKMVFYKWRTDPMACVLGGTLHELFRDFKDQADFLCVYLAEAHPRERWNFGQEFNKMEQHKTLQDRIDCARALMDVDAQHYQTFTEDTSSQTKLRLVLDDMDNCFALTYEAHPDRIIVVDGGRVTFIGRDIRDQMDEPHELMTEEAREWLQQRFDQTQNLAGKL